MTEAERTEMGQMIAAGSIIQQSFIQYAVAGIINAMMIENPKCGKRVVEVYGILERVFETSDGPNAAIEHRMAEMFRGVKQVYEHISKPPENAGHA